MKLKRILLTSILAASSITLAACNKSDTKDESSITSKVESTTSKDSTYESTNAEKTIEANKQNATKTLNELVNDYVSEITNQALKSLVINYYNQELEKINNTITLEESKQLVTKVGEDTLAFVKETIKPFTIEMINTYVTDKIKSLTNSDLKTSLEEFKNTELIKLNNLQTLKEMLSMYSTIVKDIEEYISNNLTQILAEVKTQAISELTTFLSSLIEEIDDTNVQTSLNNMLVTLTDTINKSSDEESVKKNLNESKETLLNEAIKLVKAKAVDKVNELLESGLSKLSKDSDKEDLRNFVSEKLSLINNCNKLESIKETLTNVLTDTTKYINSFLNKKAKEIITKVVDIENVSPYDYIPSTMRPSYSTNLVDANFNYDFTNDTSVSEIKKQGYGEQWHMVCENLNQAEAMSKVFNVSETIINSAFNAINSYLDLSYSDSIDTVIENDTYKIIFKLDSSKALIDLSIKTSQTLPLIGKVNPRLVYNYDLSNDEKSVNITLGDSYKVKYTITDSLYEIALNYGVSVSGVSGSRSSYLSIDTTNSSNKVGHIYEYTTLSGKDMIKACADFYINDATLTVVGNKASGIVAFKGYINELYDLSTGYLLGYDVRETLSAIEYNTYWFNLYNITGINSVKVLDLTDSNPSSKSTSDVYLNGSSSLLSPTYNKKLTVKTSRKYDIELRKIYYYYLDSDNNIQEIEENIPMMFIQEDNSNDTNYSDFVSDFKTDNNIDVSINLSTTYINKITSDHSTYIPVFINNKDNMSSDKINEYLND